MVKVKNLTPDGRILEDGKSTIEVDPFEEFEVSEECAYGDEWSSGLHLQPEIWQVPTKKASAKADPKKEK